MPNKILLITQVFYPDEVSTANLFTNLCSILVGDKIEVEVWCSQPSYSVFKKQPKSILFNGIKIFYLASTNFPKTNFYGRILNYLTFTISVVVKLLFSKDKTLVLTHTTPPSLGIIVSLICQFKNRKFLYVLLDIFPEGLIRLGKVSKRNLFVIIWQRLFLLSLKRSSRIIVIGRDMQHWIGYTCPEVVDKIEYIPLWQDEDLISPVDYDQNAFVVEHGLKEKFVIQYSGNMGLWNEMITIGKVVKKNLDDVLFMFVGGGMRKAELLEVIGNEEIGNVLMLPFQSNETFPLVLTACHVGLVSLKYGLEGMAVPSKVYGIMAAGLPVIALVPKHSEIAYIIGEEQCGFVIEPDNLEEFIRTISLLKSDENLRKQMGINGRHAFETKYSTRKIAERYKILIEEMC